MRLPVRTRFFNVSMDGQARSDGRLVAQRTMGSTERASKSFRRCKGTTNGFVGSHDTNAPLERLFSA